MAKQEVVDFKFSFGPDSLSSGTDPYGPAIREPYTLDEITDIAQSLGFSGLQFHDDDICPEEAPYNDMKVAAKEMRKKLRESGLEVEYLVPRLWDHPFTVDGGPTANGPKFRKYAVDRVKRCIDLANMVGTRRILWWPAREGTYIRESKDPRASMARIVEFLNEILAHDKKMKFLGEMRPFEPMDQSYLPTPAHFLALTHLTKDPDRLGVLIRSSGCVLSGLDPSDEMAFAMYHRKLWGVHLNDQNGIRFEQGRAFGSVNLRRALNQVAVLDRYGYGRKGEFVGLSVRALRTQSREIACKHLENSKRVFLALLDIVRSTDFEVIQGYIDARDYEGLEAAILGLLMGGGRGRRKRKQ